MINLDTTQNDVPPTSRSASSLQEGVTFLALARDCAAYLPRLFSILDEATNQGFAVRCQIGENGSVDGTRNSILARTRHDHRITLISTDAMSEAPSRLARMALGRDILRSAWSASREDDAFVCVLDLDNVLPAAANRIDLRGAVDHLADNPSLAGISASSRPYYYDLLALRIPGTFNYDVGPTLTFAHRDPLFHYMVHKRLIYPMQRTITTQLPLETESSFNGMCLYRARDYATASYTRLPLIDECEHVDFHRQLCLNGRHILAGSWFDLEMPAEHGPRKFGGFLAQRLAKLVRFT